MANINQIIENADDKLAQALEDGNRSSARYWRDYVAIATEIKGKLEDNGDLVVSPVPPRKRRPPIKGRKKKDPIKDRKKKDKPAKPNGGRP